jgi:hypothetical protein
MPRIIPRAIRKTDSEAVAAAVAVPGRYATSRSSADYAARDERGDPRGRKSFAGLGVMNPGWPALAEGKNGSARLRGTHKLRCITSHGDGSHASYGLQSGLGTRVRATVPLALPRSDRPSFYENYIKHGEHLTWTLVVRCDRKGFWQGVCIRPALARFRIRIDREPEQADVSRMARAQGISVYDAAYLELAYREKLPLATLDRRLGVAARLVGVQLFEKAG